MCSRLLSSERTNNFFLLAQVTNNTWLCRSGPRQLFFFLFVTGTGPGGLNPFYSCFFTEDLEKIFFRSKKLFVKKVAVKRSILYKVAAKSCFYKRTTVLYVSWQTQVFCLLRLCASFYKTWPLTMYMAS